MIRVKVWLPFSNISAAIVEPDEFGRSDISAKDSLMHWKVAALQLLAILLWAKSSKA
jgi:hypothetical protein